MTVVDKKNYGVEDLVYFYLNKRSYDKIKLILGTLYGSKLQIMYESVFQNCEKYSDIFFVRNLAPPLAKAVGSRNMSPKLARKNTTTRIDNSGESVRAMLIIPVKNAPAQVIQNPARTAPGKESNHLFNGWKIFMVRYRSL